MAIKVDISKFSAYILFYCATLLIVQQDTHLRLTIAGLAILPLAYTSYTDSIHSEIPDVASLSIAILGILSLGFLSAASVISSLALAILVMISLWFLGGLYWRRNGHEALGIGDAKLLAAGTLMVGAERFWIMLLLASLGGIVAALISRKGREEGIPFGPFIAYAIFVTFCMSDPEP